MDAQLTLVAAISVFGDSSVTIFITKLKIFDGLGEQMLLDGHKYITRFGNKRFITEEFVIDWTNQIVWLWIEEL
jgi:hypothetical protein